MSVSALLVDSPEAAAALDPDRGSRGRLARRRRRLRHGRASPGRRDALARVLRRRSAPAGTASRRPDPCRPRVSRPRRGGAGGAVGRGRRSDGRRQGRRRRAGSARRAGDLRRRHPHRRTSRASMAWTRSGPATSSSSTCSSTRWAHAPATTSRSWSPARSWRLPGSRRTRRAGRRGPPVARRRAGTAMAEPRPAGRDGPGGWNLLPAVGGSRARALAGARHDPVHARGPGPGAGRRPRLSSPPTSAWRRT